MLNKKDEQRQKSEIPGTWFQWPAGLLLLNNIDAMARVLNEKVAEVIQQPTARHHYCFQMEAANPLPPEKDKIYDTCDIMPEFPGGAKCIIAVSC